MVFTPRDAQVVRGTPLVHDWVTPTLTGGANVGGGYVGARYTRLPSGLVVLQGWVTVSNTTATTLFTLLAGYRPSSNLACTVGKYAGGMYGVSGLEVRTNGNVIYPAGLVSGNALYFQGLCWPAEA